MLVKNLYKYSLIILLQLIVVSSSFAKPRIVHLEPVQAPDDVPFYDEAQKKHTLDEFENQLVLLVFWASWCAPCASQMSSLDNLQKDFRKLPFTVLAVSEDEKGIDIVQKFFQAQEIKNLKIYFDNKHELSGAFKVVGTPTAFLINQQGKILLSFIGATNWYDEDIRQIINSHLPIGSEPPKNSSKPSDLNQQTKKPTIKDK